MKDLPDSFWRAAIASGALVPPPGGYKSSLGTIVAWLAGGGLLAGMCLAGFLYGAWSL